MRDNGIHVLDDAEQVRIALTLRASTPEDTTLAVVQAGAIPYFARRRCVDLLGKNDSFIARGDPVPGEPLFPGHVKWNYEHSIGRLRPDIIVSLWGATERDFEYLESLGYERRSGGGYALRLDTEGARRR